MLVNITRRFILQKARRHMSCMLRLLVGTRFQVLFHSAPAVLFTFPSRYYLAIGCQGVFSLRRWSSRIPTGFLVSRGTWVPAPQSLFSFAYGVLTLYDRPSHAVRLKNNFLTLRGACSLLHAGPSTPSLQRLHPITQVRFRLFRVRSPLLAESLLFSLPRGT